MAATNADPACTYLEAARSRVVVYDGGAGTWLQQQGLTADDFGGPDLEGCNEVLNATRPDVVTAFHDAFLAVGVGLLYLRVFAWHAPVAMLAALTLLATLFYDGGSAAGGQCDRKRGRCHRQDGRHGDGKRCRANSAACLHSHHLKSSSLAPELNQSAPPTSIFTKYTPLAARSPESLSPLQTARCSPAALSPSSSVRTRRPETS